MKPYDEIHQQGNISFEQDIKQGMIVGDIGIQIAKDGRIWICVNGQALIRFRPTIDLDSLNKKTCNNCQCQKCQSVICPIKCKAFIPCDNPVTKCNDFYGY